MHAKDRMATGHDIAMGLRAAYLSMHRQTNSHLAPFGVTADQFVLLALLSEQDGITQQELVRRASSDPNTIRAMLVLLENRGLVARGQHPTDGRALRVTLTRKGRQAYAKQSAGIKCLQDRLSALFKAEEAETLIMFLDGILEAMTQPERRHQRAPSVTSAATIETVKTEQVLKGEKR
jgi:DNA-binding MarR family transcriptional regulator